MAIQAPARLIEIAYLFAGDYEVAANAPNTWEELKAVRNAAVLPVWNGASETSIWGREANYAFRAWHDRVHLAHELSFTPEDEAQVAAIQRAQVLAMTGDVRLAELVWADVFGQGQYLARYGEFPNNQAAFMEAYINEGAAALERRF